MNQRFFDKVVEIDRRSFLGAAAGTAVLASMPGMVKKAFAGQPTAGTALPVGDFTVTPLFDGPTNFPLSLFRGADEATMLKVAGVQPIPGAFNVFLIRHGQERFLVDTGTGALLPGRTGQLPLCLADAQTLPADIGKIFITHLHADHAGGLVKDGKPAFPNATVYMSQTEYGYWTSDEAMRRAPQRVRDLSPQIREILDIVEQNRPIIRFTSGDRVFPNLTSVALPGHTPGHTGYVLESRGKRLFFAADLLHGAALQFPRPDITIDFDVDQPMAGKTRLRTFRQLVEEKTPLPIACVHVPFPGVGLLQRAGNGYRLTAWNGGTVT